MEKSSAWTKLPVAGNNAGPAIDAGDITFVLPRGNVHKAYLVKVVKVCAFISPRDIHLARYPFTLDVGKDFYLTKNYFRLSGLLLCVKL